MPPVASVLDLGTPRGPIGALGPTSASSGLPKCRFGPCAQMPGDARWAGLRILTWASGWSYRQSMAHGGKHARQGPTYRRFYGPTAEELELIASYLADLDGASNALAKMATTPDIDTRVMLWECAVVRYARVFTSGVRPRVKVSASPSASATAPAPAVEVFDLASDLAEVHREILALRDKHIAHSVNHMEVAVAVVGLTDVSKGLDPEFLGARTLSMRQVPVSSGTADPFRRLIEDVRTAFQKRHDDLCADVNRELAVQPLEDLYARPPLSVRPAHIPITAARPQLRR